MYGYILQDWITIRGNTTVTSIGQSESGWLGLAPFQDIVLWLDVREFSVGGATSLLMHYETAPTKDESLFTDMVTPVTVALSASPIVPTKILLAQNPTVPLGRWVRWRLTLNGTATSAWDATFRILACCNAVGAVANG
jgi:hypothetical protein